MAEFAQFVVPPDADNSFQLPDAGQSSRVFTFDLADLDPARTVVVMFMVWANKTVATATPRLKMTLDKGAGAEPAEFDISLSSPAYATPRSWHEVVGKGIFKASDNRLVLQGPAPGSGAVVGLSDLVVLYHGKTP